MKKFNYIIIILFLLLTSCTKAQTVNILSVNDFYNAKFNNITLNEIRNTKGDIISMKALFNNNITYIKENEPNLTIEFSINGGTFYFEDDTDTGADYTLTNASIDNNLSHFTILGNTITIGDNISKLGNILINTDLKGIKNITFSTNTSVSDLILIDFNQTSNKITSIQYIFFNN